MGKINFLIGRQLKFEALQHDGHTVQIACPANLKEEQMKNRVRKLYVGIDVHSREHKAAVIPIALLQELGNAWSKVKPLSIRNNIADFERLDTAIASQVSSTEVVAIAVDHTGGHYSEPMVYFLQAR